MTCLSSLYRILCCKCGQPSNQTASQPQASAPQVQQAAKISRVSSVSMPVLQIFNIRNNSQILNLQLINPQFIIRQEVVSSGSSSNANIGKARSSTTLIAPSEIAQQQDQEALNEITKKGIGGAIPIIPMLDKPARKEATQASDVSSSVEGSHKIQTQQESTASASSSSSSNGVASPSEENDRMRSNSAPIRKTESAENTAAREAGPHTPYIPRLVRRCTNEEGKPTTQTVYFVRHDHHLTEHASTAIAALQNLSKHS